MVENCADEQILKEEGCRDFSQYLAVPGTPEKDLIPDFFLDEVDDPQQVIAAGKGGSKVSKMWSNIYVDVLVPIWRIILP